MKNIFTLLLLCLGLTLMAQEAPNYYAIKFLDKDNNSFSLDNPEEFLSARSITRRLNQEIAYDITDLPITTSYVEGVAAIGVDVKRKVKWINTILVSTSDTSLIENVLKLDYVESITKIIDTKNNPPIKPKSFFAVEDALPVSLSKRNKKQSRYSLDYGDATDQIKMINGIPLHEKGYQGQGMVIAVLDAGFIGVPERKVFDSLYANGHFLGARDFASEENNPFVGSNHGTGVLSTMAANWPGKMIGTAPKADYWLLRTESTDYENIIEEYNWLVGAAFADSVGADIINSSLGYNEFDDESTSHTWDDLDGNTSIITIGADLAAKKGILPVNSAGNDGGNDWKYIACPADADSVLTIGSVDYDGNISGFSSRGYPGDSRVKPNICAVGSGTIVADAYYDAITASSGTSFSSPTIAGMTACLWQANPKLNNQEIIDLIESSSSQSKSPDKDFGYGIPDYEVANSGGIVGVKSNVDNQPAVFEIFPNPTSDFINLDFKGKISEIIIYSSNGQIVYRSYGEQTYINVSKLSAGIYVLQLITEKGISKAKFLKK